MKTQKSKTFLFTFLFIFSINTSQAGFFENFKALKERLTKSYELAQDLADSELKTVNNSLLNVSGEVSQEFNWVMVLITKDNFKEQILVPVSNGLFNVGISLQDGAGIYEIELYSSYLQFSSNYEIFKKFSVENTDQRDMGFLLPTLKVQVDDIKIKNLVSTITKKSRNDKEAFEAIYNYVTSTIKYDVISANNGSYIYKDYSAVNTLLTNVATCEGYANLIAAMSRSYGIKTKIIHGIAIYTDRSVQHAWNEVFINNEWKVVDSTLDAFYKNKKYLFMNPNFFARDHIKQTETKY